ncbi:cadherin-like beta sandwich domain-containing protein [uncultured Clostridium sp.]|uniref:N-acetylmuramoyl-L-alanine amidase family protein n=1 Tax=uncultured Clostridium sp. TaxID=59620 RepID=UPI0025F87A10|nr:cadherin-like beta sandwich domain-containing protein [uncultured Clostridium sp.]
MNKRIKRVIALALTISAFSTFSSVLSGNNTGLTIKSAYAASYKPSNGELSSLKIKSTNGDTLDLKDGYNGEEVKLSDDKEYYVKLTDDSDGIKIDAEVKGSDRIIRIFLSDRSDAEAYKVGDKLPLGKGNTPVYVRTYESLSDFRNAKDKKKDVTICEEEYVINVKKTKGSSYDDDTQDSIYLSKLELSKSNITFTKQRTSYDVKVSSSVDSIKITAKPENSGDRVRINGTLVDESDDYKKTISLKSGKNEIKVKVTDSKDNQRTYTLNITRGSSSNSQQDDVFLTNLETNEGEIDFNQDETSYKLNVDNDVESILVTAQPEDEEYLVTINGKEVTSGEDYKKKISLDEGKNTIKVVVEDEVNDKKRTYTLTVNRKESKKAEEIDNNNKDNSNSEENSNKNESSNSNGIGWVKTDNGWQYKDESGKILKKQWLYDKEQGVYCYLKEDGYRATGWLQDDGKWYLLDSKGAMLTGWQFTGGKWYYLNSDGSMKSGWLKIENDVEDTSAATKTDSDSNSNTNKAESGGKVSGTASATDSASKNDAKAEENTATDNSVEAKTEKKTKKVTKWYYLNTDGAMVTGWLNSGSWYYLNTDGAMHTGWLIDNNSKYYLNESGQMVTGTQTIEGKQYKFSSGGALMS